MKIVAKKECVKCGRVISASNFKRHINVCNGIYFTGPHPPSRFKNQTELHQFLSNHLEKVRPQNQENYIPWNYGLNKEIDNRLKKQGEIISKTIFRLIKEGKWKKRILSKEYRQKLSIEQSENSRFKFCKWYIVNGIKVQGRWERNIAKKLIELKIEWTRPTNIEYVDDGGIIRRYTPDFYLPKYKLFLELKGYWWRNDRRKMALVIEQHYNKKIIIVLKEDYEKLLLENEEISFMNLLNNISVDI